MKKTQLLIVQFFLTLSLSAASVPDTLRVLAIANSFSADAMEQNLYEIARSDGRVIIIGNLFNGGYLLKHHLMAIRSAEKVYSYRKIGADGVKVYRESGSPEVVAEEPWDVVVLQQQSGQSGQYETFEPFLTELVREVRARVPRSCRIMLHQTWAYAQNTVSGAFDNYDRSQRKMFESICDCYAKSAKKHRLGVIPSGTAIQISRLSFNQDNATRDGNHLNRFGRYVAACTFYESLFGVSAVGNAFRPVGLSEDRVELAQNCAHAACSHPFDVRSVDVKPRYIDRYFNSLEKADTVRSYTLPDALTMSDGRKVETPEQWYGERRSELLNLFETEMFGKAPLGIDGTKYEIVEQGPSLGGTAVRKQVRIIFDSRRYIQALIYLPSDTRGGVPLFMGLNFEGNASVNPDPAILYPEERHASRYGEYVEPARGSQATRWPVEEIVRRGYGLVTFHASDVDPDFDDGFGNGVTPLIYREGQNYPDPDQWGTISAWAWGMSRVLDYLETDPDVDATRVAAIGHSRMGKTALLAAARDERFAMVISNCSGCCGAAISRRNCGETVESIVHLFPHWFCGNFFKYADDVDSLPFDQHELLALIAPRPLYVASAEQDLWADPTGERISLQEARKVYDFLGLDRGLTASHIHEGPHEVTPMDWQYYLDFADRYLAAPRVRQEPAFTLAEGESIELPLNYVRSYTDFTADMTFDGPFEGVTLSRGGLDLYWGADLKITRDSVFISDFDWDPDKGSTADRRESFAHGMSIGRDLRAEISTREFMKGCLILSSGGRTFSRDIRWIGGGKPSVKNDGRTSMTASVSFANLRASDRIWFLADSYFSEVDPERWPYHMVREGIRDGWMSDNIPGGCSAELLECFRNDLESGQPQIAVWMLGMNDVEKNEKMNAGWMASVREFVRICANRGIIPVLTTIPDVPGRCHSLKTAWVRSSGYRFIDWAVSVQKGDGSRDWKEGMLSEDLVHPTETGAKALWEAVIDAVPELKNRPPVW